LPDGRNPDASIGTRRKKIFIEHRSARSINLSNNFRKFDAMRWLTAITRALIHFAFCPSWLTVLPPTHPAR